VCSIRLSIARRPSAGLFSFADALRELAVSDVSRRPADPAVDRHMFRVDHRQQNLLDTHGGGLPATGWLNAVFGCDLAQEAVVLGVAGERIAVSFNAVIAPGAGAADDPAAAPGKAQSASAASSTGR
jgi:hypothetical protein